MATQSIDLNKLNTVIFKNNAGQNEVKRLVLNGTEIWHKKEWHVIRENVTGVSAEMSYLVKFGVYVNTNLPTRVSGKLKFIYNVYQTGTIEFDKLEIKEYSNKPQFSGKLGTHDYSIEIYVENINSIYAMITSSSIVMQFSFDKANSYLSTVEQFY